VPVTVERSLLGEPCSLGAAAFTSLSPDAVEIQPTTASGEGRGESPNHPGDAADGATGAEQVMGTSIPMWGSTRVPGVMHSAAVGTASGSRVLAHHALIPYGID
jgi:hypothetical protein